ncbi:MAG: hypothetical protein ABSB71_06210 [Candidatus Bathyarchaeia archaeon]|jgi:hypothetical protein
MQIAKNKTAAIAIAIFLMFSMSASMMLVPTASAHTPAWTIPTFAYINAAPNPVGVGQQATIIFWLNNVYDNAALANDYRFHNYKLTITAPDGTTETRTFATVTDPTSSQYILYTPTQVGTYNLTFNFPGQNINDYSHATISTVFDFATFTYVTQTNPAINDTYLPSSASTTLTVQQAQLASPITSYPLPQDYWTRPIYGENTDWWTISSNWLGTGSPGYSGFGFNSRQQSYPGDAIGPQTGHVMWTKPLQSGGVVGGNNFLIQGDTYFEGSAYNQRFTNPIIVNGKLYYTESLSFGGNQVGPTDCVDLQTGQLIWSRSDVPAPSFAYIYDLQDPNQHGVYPAILFSGGGGFFSFGPVTWRAFDADTGDPMFNITNVPSGTSVLGVNGEYLTYALTNDGTFFAPQYYLSQWNMSKLWNSQYSGASTSPSVIPPITNGADLSLYDWNVSIPSITAMPTIDYAFFNNMLICQTGAQPSSGASSSPYTYFALNLNATKGAIGSVLWTNTVQPPVANVSVTIGPADPTAGVFTEAYQQTMQWVGYSMSTGKPIWGPTPSQNAFDYYGTPAFPYVQGVGAYGKLYSSGFGGILYTYDMATGNLLWTYGNGGAGNSTRAGFYNAYGEYPTFINAIGNGVIYLITTEHTVETPIYKGALARAVNATDGSEIWTLSGYTGEFFTTSYAIADGYATWFNGYDNQIYVVGRGPSATTVTASPKVSTYGGNVLIEGTVVDVSAGTTQTQQAADFPNGVPCASDASMKDWMGYVYQQKPLPTNFTGVPVEISVADSNGNHYDIGTATTSITGAYSLTWTPTIPGNFTVIATFAGTNGYWPSYTETAFNIMNAPAATPSPTPTPASMADQYILPIGIAIIVVIIIIGAVLALLIVRKRP